MEKPIAATRRRIKTHTRCLRTAAALAGPGEFVPAPRRRRGRYFSSQRSRKRGMRSGIQPQFWTFRLMTANSAV